MPDEQSTKRKRTLTEKAQEHEATKARKTSSAQAASTVSRAQPRPTQASLTASGFTTKNPPARQQAAIRLGTSELNSNDNPEIIDVDEEPRRRNKSSSGRDKTTNDSDRGSESEVAEKTEITQEDRDEHGEYCLHSKKGTLPAYRYAYAVLDSNCVWLLQRQYSTYMGSQEEEALHSLPVQQCWLQGYCESLHGLEG